MVITFRESKLLLLIITTKIIQFDIDDVMISLHISLNLISASDQPCYPDVVTITFAEKQ